MRMCGSAASTSDRQLGNYYSCVLSSCEQHCPQQLAEPLYVRNPRMRIGNGRAGAERGDGTRVKIAISATLQCRFERGRLIHTDERLFVNHRFLARERHVRPWLLLAEQKSSH